MISKFKVKDVLESFDSSFQHRSSRTNFFFQSKEGLLFLNSNMILGTSRLPDQIFFENLGNPKHSKVLKTSETNSLIDSLVSGMQGQVLFVSFQNGELHKYTIKKNSYTVSLEFTRNIDTQIRLNYSFIISNDFVFCVDCTSIRMIDHSQNHLVKVFEEKQLKRISGLAILRNQNKWILICFGKLENGVKGFFSRIDVTRYVTNATRKKTKNLLDKKTLENGKTRSAISTNLKHQGIQKKRSKNDKVIKLLQPEKQKKNVKYKNPIKKIHKSKTKAKEITHKSQEKRDTNQTKQISKNKVHLQNKSTQTAKQIKHKQTDQNQNVLDLKKQQQKYDQLKQKSFKVINQLKAKLTQSKQSIHKLKAKNKQLNSKIQDLSSKLDSRNRIIYTLTKKNTDLRNRLLKENTISDLSKIEESKRLVDSERCVKSFEWPFDIDKIYTDSIQNSLITQRRMSHLMINQKVFDFDSKPSFLVVSENQKLGFGLSQIEFNNIPGLVIIDYQS